MKKKDIEKMKVRTVAELTADIGVAKEKLWQTKKDIAGSKVKNVREVRSIRTEIARMMTLINAKKNS